VDVAQHEAVMTRRKPPSTARLPPVVSSVVRGGLDG
jgi:hypothetical protein